jgi:prevent-host-death family protein
MSSLNSTKARDGFADTINRAAYGKERVIVERRGKPIAAVVPIEDLHLLEQLEDQQDALAAQKILADPKEEFRSWEEAKKDLGL